MRASVSGNGMKRVQRVSSFCNWILLTIYSHTRCVLSGKAVFFCASDHGYLCVCVFVD